MKLRPPSNVLGSSRRREGIALVVVLSILALLIVLVIGFFSSITSETVSSGHYAAATNARSLADSALGMVMSQIRLATSNSNGSTAWTSQPGMLRTFDATGSAKEVFKLYSADAMRKQAADYHESDDSAELWKTESPQWYRALYADINQPVATVSGALSYPIVDPRAQQADITTGRQPVAGFSLTGSSASGASQAPGYLSGTDDSPENNPAAMPVTWLYVLQDGRIAVPQSVDGQGNVTFSASGVLPSASNPVIGRVAFWTDDDTSKLNVNTAGYGVNSDNYWTYWDTPYFYSSEEETYLSQNQPWTGEYQRYPGHPSTVSLNTVLPELAKWDLFKMTPRLQAASGAGAAGSDGGTYRSDTPTPLSAKHDRLYESVDELLYSAVYDGSNHRTANLGSLTKADMDTKRFFLTACNRSPDLNLFGLPRVTIWPVPYAEGSRTALDKLIAFCGSSSKEPFYFVRNDPMSPTADFNFGSNAKLYAYLQRLTGQSIPGFGGPATGFLSKYGTDRDQILTSIFDTIRITNLADKGTATPYTSNDNSGQVMGMVVPTENPNGTRGAGRMFCIKEAALVFSSNNCVITGTGGTVVTSTTPQTSSTSSMVMGVLFDFWQPAAGAIAGGANFTYTVEGLETFSVSGTASGAPSIPLFSETGAPRGNYAVVTGTDGSKTSTYTHGTREYRFSAAYGGANPQLTSISGTAMTGVGTSSSCTFDLPPTSDEVKLIGTNFKFNGGTITVTIRAPKETASADYVQKYTFQFPPINSLRVPSYQPGNMPWSTQNAAANAPQFTVDGRFYISDYARLIQSTDIVRAVQLTGSANGNPLQGDLRIAAHKKDIPKEMFAPAGALVSGSAAYFGTSAQVHGLRRIGGYNFGGTMGNLIQDFTPGTVNVKPDLPASVNGVRNASGGTGDWDNGCGFLADGPYLPKSDEGILANPGYFYVALLDKLTYKGNLGSLFSPNRQIPSAGFFGGIPTGVARGLPWQTLLFRPARAFHPGGPDHPGVATPPDYLLLDLFQMPVVEPYAISEPLSTAGKVNMNYRVKPFSYIRRDTAVRAVLGSVRLTAIPEEALGSTYAGYIGKSEDVLTGNGSYPGHTRYNINPDETLKQFDSRFNMTDASGKPVFVSETEICNLDLVPSATGITLNTLSAFWSDKRTTGDNSRERPYALLYPRLTTKSNTYTVYMTAQSLTAPPAYRDGWNEKRGSVTGEWRGEYAIERYIDPNDSGMPSILTPSGDLSDTAVELSQRYKFRTRYIKRFAP